MIFSVIIPAYNAGKYIDNCLKSVMLQQTASYEVILVNDGSTDETGQICRKWVQRYSNIVYLEQENKGQGTARNVAIDHAAGEWLVFLDADDEMLPGALGFLERNISEEYDILEYGCIFVSSERKWSGTYIPYDSHDKKRMMQETTSVLWDKIFRASLWKGNGICMSDRYGEDIRPVYMLMAEAEKIHVIQKALVLHYDREDNLSAQPQKILQIPESVSEVLESFRERGYFELYKTPLFFMLERQHKHYANLWKSNHRAEEKQIVDKLERLAGEYFPEEGQKAFAAEENTLIAIGKIGQPLPFELQIWNWYYYGCMEKFFSDENRIRGKVCHFIINVENEILSVTEGTRTESWMLSRWEGQCREILQMRRERNLRGTIVLYSPHRNRTERETLSNLKFQPDGGGMEDGKGMIGRMEEIAKNIWHCGQTDSLEGYWEEIINYGETGMAEDKPANEKWENESICDMNYRLEYMRLDYNNNLLYGWIKLKNREIGLKKYFLEHNYREVGIYGMGYLGKLLKDELQHADIKVLYFIDRSADGERNRKRNVHREGECEVYSPDEILPSADVVVVSVVHIYEHIRMQLKCICEVVSLQEIVNWCKDGRYSANE